jgi:hypothetical protein
MHEFGAHAVLESAPNVEGLTTSLPRSEIEQALAVEDAPLELVLDLTRFADGEPTETRKVAVAWERTDLERVLQEAQGDRVDFTFDRDTLWQAMEADVEAHGFREKAITFAVAVTAASGAAANAAAEPGAYFGAGSPPIHASATPDDRAVSRAIPTPEPTAGVDDRAVSRAIPTPEPTAGVDDRAVSRAIPTPEPAAGVDDRAVSRAIPTPEPTAGVGVDDRAVSRAVTDIPAPGSAIAADAGSSWAPSPAETAAIGGAIALAITGAAFLATGRRRRPEARPA